MDHKLMDRIVEVLWHLDKAPYWQIYAQMALQDITVRREPAYDQLVIRHLCDELVVAGKLFHVWHKHELCLCCRNEPYRA